SGMMRPTFDNLESHFMIVVLLRWWTFFKTLRGIVNQKDGMIILKKEIIKSIVKVEEKINKIWSIKQKDNESILIYTYRYETLVASIESICPMTYKEAKEWVLELEAKTGVERKETVRLDVNKVVEIGKTEIKKKNISEAESGKTSICYQQSANIGSNIAINDLNQCYQNE
ncbi:29298_t:CDS:2, partial [Gigaspora margarita]